MAKVYIKLKVMPISPEIDLEIIKVQAQEKVEAFEGKVHSVDVEPVAFGLKALVFTFMMDESKGATDPLEEDIKKIEGVNSADVIDVRRAFG